MFEELGKKLYLLRKRKNITQTELAKVIDVTKAHISNIEKGRRGLNLEQINKICNYFNINISYFISEELNNECETLIDKAKVLFESNELDQKQKDNLFASIMEIYINSKK